LKEYGSRFNIWRYSTGCNKSTKDKEAFDHPAIYPEELVKDHLISWSNENDLIYDPFHGSGTTGKMCLLLNRNFIASEISSKYVDISIKRINKYKSLFTGV
jgi:site-specific DNA-methyltransferase (adenine-specific)